MKRLKEKLQETETEISTYYLKRGLPIKEESSEICHKLLIKAYNTALIELEKQQSSPNKANDDYITALLQEKWICGKEIDKFSELSKKRQTLKKRIGKLWVCDSLACSNEICIFQIAELHSEREVCNERRCKHLLM